MHAGADRPQGSTAAADLFDPALAFVAVKDNESGDENDVHYDHDDHGGNDCAVGTANVFRIAIFH